MRLSLTQAEAGAEAVGTIGGNTAAGLAPNSIEVNDLSVRFGPLPVIERMSFAVPSGEFVSLLGPSGCGKSTLLRAIAGLVEPAAGCIRLAGDGDLRLGLMFQKPLLMPWRTTLQNVLLPVEIALGGSTVGAVDIARAERTLALVRLSGFERAYPQQLSGGMQQRVALARALMSDPQLLLLDEPFGALDELTREALNEELLRIRHSENTRLKTVVMVTHSIAEAVALSDRVLVFAPRPARLAQAVEIDLPHPRASDKPAFLQAVAQVRRAVRKLS
jgi:NitT/TauT family transport system ATP-binding protein